MTAFNAVTPRLPVGGEAVGGGEQGVLAGVGGQVGDDPSAVEHRGAIAHETDLAQLAGEHQHRRPLVGQGADEVVDLVLGADVDASRRVEEQHHAQPAGEPAGDRHLLLVAAGEPAHLARCPRVDRQPADRLVDSAALLGGEIGPHFATRLNSGRAMFSRIDRCGSKA